MLDGTYKTNRFGQVCTNVCGSAGNNMTPQLAIGFLSGEDQEDYEWLLSCFQELLAEHDIAQPVCFVSDREQALLLALDVIFPGVDHILCIWHVNMNVVANCKKHFKFKEDWDEFFEFWLKLIDSSTSGVYCNNVNYFKKFPEKAVLYCEKTWLLYKEKIVSLLLFLLI